LRFTGFSVIEDLAKISGMVHSNIAFQLHALDSASGFASNPAHTKPVKDCVFSGDNRSELKTKPTL